MSARECAISQFDGRRERGIVFPATSLLSFLVAQERKCPAGMRRPEKPGLPRRRAVRSPESERLSPHANGGAPRGGVGAPKTTQRAAEFRASERQPPSSAGSRKMFPAGGCRRWRMMAGSIAEDCPASGLARLCGAAALCSGIGWPGAQPAGAHQSLSRLVLRTSAAGGCGPPAGAGTRLFAHNLTAARLLARNPEPFSDPRAGKTLTVRTSVRLPVFLFRRGARGLRVLRQG